MTKTRLSSLFVILTASLLVACSDSGMESDTNNKAAAVQEEPADLATLMKQAESALAEANELGFEWSVTAPLLEDAYAAYEAGNEEQATALFQEVKYQSMLAIEQAHYADKHWQLLIPVID